MYSAGGFILGWYETFPKLLSLFDIYNILVCKFSTFSNIIFKKKWLRSGVILNISPALLMNLRIAIIINTVV